MIKKILYINFIFCIYITITHTGFLFANECNIQAANRQCQDIASCEEIFNNNIETIEISKLISKQSFLNLLKRIEIGEDCALRFGFKLFNLALSQSEAGYLEELSIRLSASIENNPKGYLYYLPNNLIEKDEIVTSISTMVPFDHIEDKEYIMKKLIKRVYALEQVGQTALVYKKEIVTNTILNYLKTYFNYDPK